MKLKKIKLINWHLFTNHTIDLDGNILITGENGSGKSTLMDAIYFVLSGGDSGHFNNAAGDKGQRNLKTYLRGKLGTEKNPYLRSENSIIGYIVLEYETYDKHRRVLGTEIDIVDQKDPKTTFFIVEDYSIADEDFIESGKPLEYKKFEQKIKDKNISYKKLPDVQKERKKIIGNDFFKLNDYRRFFELLQKAIAFKPLEEVSTFVNSFLLQQDNVNLDSLREEIRSYQEIHHMLEREEEKMNYLGSFIENAKKYLKNKETIRYLDALKLDSSLNKIESSLKRIEIELSRMQDKQVFLEKEEERMQNIKLNAEKELRDLEDNNLYKVIRVKEEELEKLNARKTETETKFNQFKEDFDKENKLCLALKLVNRFQSDFRNKDHALLTAHLKEYENELNKLKNESYALKADKESEEKKLKEEINKRKKELEELKCGISNYPESVKNLISLSIKAVKKYFSGESEIEIRPLCEYLEIKDEEWRDAIEGYLGNHRFDLIFHSKYFDTISREIENKKDTLNIFSSGIVNIEKISEEGIKENALIEKVEVNNSRAAKYVRYLLGDVICANGVKDISNHFKSVTKDVLIYKGNVLNVCDPEKYAMPFIGKNSIQKRISILCEAIDESNCKAMDLKKEINKLQTVSALCNESKIIELLKHPDYWSDLSNLEKEILRLQSEISDDRKDDGVLAIYEKIEKTKEKIHKIQDEYVTVKKESGENQRYIGAKQHEFENLKSQQTDITESLKIKLNALVIDEYNSIKQEYHEKGMFKELNIKDDIDRANNSNNSIKSSLLDAMRRYSNSFNQNLVPDTENIKSFIFEYENLKNRDIIHYKSEARTAYERAEISFREDFISKLRNKIEESQKMMDKLNKNLLKHPFGIDEEIYQFYYQKTKDDEFGNYYRIITSGKLMDAKDLFSEVLDAKDNQYMQDLFNRVSMETDSAEAERELEKYLDYRNYMNYDIKIKNKYGDESYYSKISREKSGGETQTPFYIVIAACFDELMNKKSECEESTCQVVFDEAFNNMDESRIKSLMQFYSQLNIQLIIVVPSNRIPSIAPYMNTLVGIVKLDNYPNIVVMEGSYYE